VQAMAASRKGRRFRMFQRRDDKGFKRPGHYSPPTFLTPVMPYSRVIVESFGWVNIFKRANTEPPTPFTRRADRMLGAILLYLVHAHTPPQ
jgi:hypothetical protein